MPARQEKKLRTRLKIWTPRAPFTRLFLWQMSSSFYSFTINSKTAGRRKLKFSHIVGIHHC